MKAEQIEAFTTATIENHRQSIGEPGIARFDFVQQQDDPTRFVIVEAFYNKEAVLAHKETAHYPKWKETVEDMMAEPRYSIKYDSVCPEEGGW